MLGAIIITSDRNHAAQDDLTTLGSGLPVWAATEILGKAPVARLADSLGEVCDGVSVIVDGHRPGTAGRDSDPGLASGFFASYKQKGFTTILIIFCGAYVELDVAEMLATHQQLGFGVTRATDNDGPLDAWMVDASAVQDYSAIFSWHPCSSYRSRGYVNRLQSPRDFRRLVLDSFHSRCLLRPYGSELKPGIWIGDGAQIERSARIVAPAFLGRNVQISDECLITRGSNVESNSLVDFGTAVENSSILPNSYVGIGLDLSHSVVDGHNLLNLRHDVNLVITDPVVLCQIRVSGKGHQPSAAGVDSSQMALSSAG